MEIMRWIGLGVAFLGGFMFLVSLTVNNSVNAQAKLVQFVKGTELVGKPRLAFLTEETKVVKGSGPEGSTFVEVGSKVVSVENYRLATALAKMASLVVLGLGCVGFAFESWRRKTARILSGISNEKLVD